MAESSSPAASSKLKEPVVDAASSGRNGGVASPSKSQSTLLVLQTIAGATSGAIAKTATAPFERVKIIFQVQVSYIDILFLPIPFTHQKEARF